VQFDLDKLVLSSGFKQLSHQFQQAIAAFPFLLPFSLRTKVGTSDCGFLTTPCYTARVAGSRVYRLPVENEEGSPVEVPVFADGLVQIIEPDPDSFVMDVQPIIQVLSHFEIPLSDVAGLLEQLKERLLSDWEVEWMGVEG
jgi:hypothetical protein